MPLHPIQSQYILSVCWSGDQTPGLKCLILTELRRLGNTFKTAKGLYRNRRLEFVSPTSAQSSQCQMCFCVPKDSATDLGRGGVGWVVLLSHLTAVEAEASRY